MSILTKINNLMGLETIDDSDESIEQEIKDMEKSIIPNAPSAMPSDIRPMPPRPAAAPAAPKPASKFTNHTNPIKMVVIEPGSFEESPRLVDSLKAKKPVIINLENLETDVARKIFDFLSGATYALNGNVQRITNNIFLFAPENVDVSYNETQKANILSDTAKNPWK